MFIGFLIAQAGCFVEKRLKYAEPEQEITANLIHRSYISQKDIAACLNFDFSKHSTHTNFQEMGILHQKLAAIAA